MIQGNWFSVRKASKCRGRFPGFFNMREPLSIDMLKSGQAFFAGSVAKVGVRPGSEGGGLAAA